MSDRPCTVGGNKYELISIPNLVDAVFDRDACHGEGYEAMSDDGGVRQAPRMSDDRNDSHQLVGLEIEDYER